MLLSTLAFVLYSKQYNFTLNALHFANAKSFNTLFFTTTDNRETKLSVCLNVEGKKYYSSENKLTINFLSNEYAEHKGALISFKTGEMPLITTEIRSGCFL